MGLRASDLVSISLHAFLLFSIHQTLTELHSNFIPFSLSQQVIIEHARRKGCDRVAVELARKEEGAFEEERERKERRRTEERAGKAEGVTGMFKRIHLAPDF